MLNWAYIGIALVIAALSAVPVDAGGLPDDAPIVIPAPRGPVTVQSSDALSPSAYTANGRFAASSGDVDPGEVTILPEVLWMPDVVVEVDDRLNRRFLNRRPPVPRQLRQIQRQGF